MGCLLRLVRAPPTPIAGPRPQIRLRGEIPVIWNFRCPLRATVGSGRVKSCAEDIDMGPLSRVGRAWPQAQFRENGMASPS